MWTAVTVCLHTLETFRRETNRGEETMIEVFKLSKIEEEIVRNIKELAHKLTHEQKTHVMDVRSGDAGKCCAQIF